RADDIDDVIGAANLLEKMRGDESGHAGSLSATHDGVNGPLIAARHAVVAPQWRRVTGNRLHEKEVQVLCGALSGERRKKNRVLKLANGRKEIAAIVVFDLPFVL